MYAGSQRSSATLRREPVFTKPSDFEFNRLAAAIERSQRGAADGRQINRPLARRGGLDVRATLDSDFADRVKIDRFVVDQPDVSVGLNN